MALSYNPLNDSHCQVCNNILQSIHEPLQVAEACIACGYPAEEIRDQLLTIKKRAELIKQHFFPTKP